MHSHIVIGSRDGPRLSYECDDLSSILQESFSQSMDFGHIFLWGPTIPFRRLQPIDNLDKDACSLSPGLGLASRPFERRTGVCQETPDRF